MLSFSNTIMLGGAGICDLMQDFMVKAGGT